MLFLQSPSHHRCVRRCLRVHARTHTQSDCSSALEVLPVSKRAATHTEFFKQTLHVGVDLSAAPPVGAPARPAQQPRRQRSSRGVSGFPGAPTLAPRHSPDTVSVTPTCPWDGSAWVLPLHSVRLPWGSVAMSPPAVQETQVRSLAREDPLEKGMATHRSVLVWRIPWTEEPGELQSMGSQSRTRLTN